jgi:hypothetical protein
MKEFVFRFDFFLYICFYYKQYLMIVLCLKIILFFLILKQSYMIVYICLKQYLLVKSAYLNNYGIGNIILEIIY